MKFETMMSYWKMKGMIHHESCQTRTRIYDSDARHVVYSMELRDIPRNGNQHAHVIYRYTLRDNLKSKFALIYADILFTGFRPAPDSDQVFIKNAKVCDLAEYFIKQS